MSESSHESKSSVLSRREALKVLAAASGAVALSNLPLSWKSPIVEVGVIPAHAQGASGPAPSVRNVSGYFTRVGASSQARTKSPGCSQVRVTFQYQDSLGKVANGSLVSGVFASVENYNGSAVTLGGSDGYSGSAYVPFYASTCVNGSAAITVRLLAQGRYSNVANGVISQTT